MKGFGMLAVGLSLLVTSASAQEVKNLAPTLKITVGKAVTTLHLPAPLLGAKKPGFDVTGKQAEVVPNLEAPTLMVMTGDATLSYSRSLKATADEIRVTLVNKKPTSFTLRGKVVIKVQDPGKEVMQIKADMAVLEPQYSTN